MRKAFQVLFVVALLVAPIGAWEAYNVHQDQVFSSSREPPFPLAWSASLPGSPPLGLPTSLLVGGSDYLLRELEEGGNLTSSCNYQVLSISPTNGVRSWATQPFAALGSPFCRSAALFYSGREVYFVGAESSNDNHLLVKQIDAGTGQILATVHLPQPAGPFFPGQFAWTSFNGTAYALQLNQIGKYPVAAITLGTRVGLAWQKNITINGKDPGSYTGTPFLYAYTGGLALVCINESAATRSRLFEVDLGSNGSVNHSGPLPGGSGGLDVLGVANGILYYTANMSRVYGEKLGTGEMVANFSTTEAGSALDGINAVGSQLVLTSGTRAFGYSTGGTMLWSVNMTVGQGFQGIRIVLLSHELVMMQGWSREVFFFAPGMRQIYDATYMLVNSTNGHVISNVQFRPWVNVQGSVSLPPPYYVVVGGYGGYILIEGDSSLYGVQTSSIL